MFVRSGEDFIVAIMEQYLKAKHYTSGPDFLINGKACEVKGSYSDFADSLKQLGNYVISKKYTDVVAILPVDFLAGLYKLYTFHLFCEIIKTVSGKDLVLILVGISEDKKTARIKSVKGADLLQMVEVRVPVEILVRQKDEMIQGVNIRKIEKALTRSLESLVAYSGVKVSL